ncbi:Aim25p [Sporobolomyces salmoneus]|uniref:Aim25p n=1 Tax=Sporobolomyces salmoneus TaxID=183962 RepID=UPI00317BA7EB
MLARTLNTLTKAIKVPTTSSPTLYRSASRFTRSRRSIPTTSSTNPSHSRTTPHPATSTSTEPLESTELSILGPPISRIPVRVPQDSEGVLDVARGEWSTKVKELLSQPAIVVARQIEFMNIFLGFEQANRYQLLSPEGNLLGYLLEEEVGIAGTLKRQFLRTHRPFRATVLSPEGQVLLNIHRPFTFINSRIYVSTPASNTATTAQEAKREMELVEQNGSSEGRESEQIVIGEAAQVWNLIRRKYETFVKRDGEMVQFGNIDSGFLAWDFSVRDEQGKVIASINRNFTGFARELFADVGQYVLRFEGVVDELNPQLESPQTSGSLPSPSTSSSTSLAPTSSSPSATSPTESTSLVPSASDTPSIPLDHRATLLATAVSIDFDFFSRHSGAGGMGGLGGFMPLPIPIGGFGGGGAAGEAGEAAEGAGGMGGEVAGIEREARRGEIGSGTPYGDDGRTLPSSEDVERDRDGRWPNREDDGNGGGGWGSSGSQEEELMQDPWAQEPSQEDDGGTWGWGDLFPGDGDE